MDVADHSVSELKVSLLRTCQECKGEGAVRFADLLGAGCSLVSGPEYIPCKACDSVGFFGFEVDLNDFVNLIAKRLEDNEA